METLRYIILMNGLRISMIMGRRSGTLVWCRYIVCVLLMATMGLACRHEQTEYQGTVFKRVSAPFPLTNATRVLAAELEKENMPWFSLSTLVAGENHGDTVRFQNRVIIGPSTTTHFPEILCLRNNNLDLKLPEGQQAKLFINGQPSTVKTLTTLPFEQVNDLFVYKKWDDAPGADTYPESYRVFISTTHKTQKPDRVRVKWKQYLQANAISDYPLGNSNTFSMNKLLEATFFTNKLAFVKRTKDDYLELYDDYANDIDLYINGLPVDKKSIETVHVREVDKLYTHERPFDKWADGPNREHRYILYIKTAPKRAKRDSSYYVFSPFYSGDF